MKTWCLRRVRNMSRVDFGWCLLENVEELLLSMFLHVWAWDYICSSVLAYAGVFLRFCVHGNGPAYTGSCLHVWALTRVRGTPGRSLAFAHFYLFFTFFTFLCNSNTLFFFFFVVFAFEHHCNILFIFTCASKHHIPWISLESWT